MSGLNPYDGGKIADAAMLIAKTFERMADKPSPRTIVPLVIMVPTSVSPEQAKKFAVQIGDALKEALA